MADGFGGYSPYTGAGNLASAMGANPSFGGYTGGYQAYGSAPTARLPMTPGYAPSTPASPAFTPPTFTNSMSNWLGASGGLTQAQINAGYGGGGGENISAMTPSFSGDFQVPGSGGSVSASSFDQNSMMSPGYGGGGSGGYTAAQMRAGYGGGASPMGTALANLSAFPNPDVTMPKYTTADIMSGIYAGEAPGGANPYQMLGGRGNAMAQLQQWGYNVPTNAFGVPQSPTNAADSENYASEFIGHLYGQYPYAEQVATAFGPSGQANVNPNYQGPGSGTTPYKANVSLNPANNQTPQQYLYGRASSGYPGVMAGMQNSALTNQFNQAAGAGQATGAPGYMNAPAQGGRYW